MVHIPSRSATQQSPRSLKIHPHACLLGRNTGVWLQPKAQNKFPENSHEQAFPQASHLDGANTIFLLSNSFLTKPSFFKNIYHTVVADSWISTWGRYAVLKASTCHMKPTTSFSVWYAQTCNYTSCFQEMYRHGPSLLWGSYSMFYLKFRNFLVAYILVRTLAYVSTYPVA